MPFTLIPRIEVSDTLVQAPIEVASSCAEAGARWLHLVDLKAGASSGYSLIPLVKEIDRRTPLKIQTGGGVRTAQDGRSVLDAGAMRVVVEPEAIAESGGPDAWLGTLGAAAVVLAVTFDARREDGAGGRVLERFVEAGGRHVLCTAIDRDGTPTINADLWGTLVGRFPTIELQAAGLGTRNDILKAKAAGVRAGIVEPEFLAEGLELED